MTKKNATDLGCPIIRLQIRVENDIVATRQRARRIAEFFKFDNQDQARIATAVSELSRNIYQYAGTGSVEFLFALNRSPQTLFVRFLDQGPGISELEKVLGGQYVSKTGMGVGVTGSRKLMDFFEVDSQVGNGTTIVIGKHLDKRAPLIKAEALVKLADTLAASHSESPLEEVQRQNRDLLNALDQLQASKHELSELNRELNETNRGVVALYAELDEKASALQRANEVKTSFLSNMTHEFRTPLSSVISLTRILLDRLDGDLTPEQEKQVVYIRKSSESLLELVHDLLDLAKVEAGKVRISSAHFHIEELLGGIRGMFRPLLNANNLVQLKIDWHPQLLELHTDQAKVSQILRNLVSNSLKYTEQGSVEVYAELAENDSVLFTVKDTGIGIEPEHLASVFEDFSQVESKFQKLNKGTGLGLPLSRKLALLLGGDLWVESQVGMGSTFFARIPRVYEGAGEGILFKQNVSAAKKPEAELAGPKFRVMLVDDDEPSRYIIRGMIATELDAEFREVSRSEEAVEEIRRWRPDLIILDLTMPNKDGFEVLDQLKSNDETSAIPVIINTAKKLTDFDRKVLESNAVAILSKERLNHSMAMESLRGALRSAGFDFKSKADE